MVTLGPKNLKQNVFDDNHDSKMQCQGFYVCTSDRFTLAKF